MSSHEACGCTVTSEPWWHPGPGDIPALVTSQPCSLSCDRPEHGPGAVQLQARLFPRPEFKGRMRAVSQENQSEPPRPRYGRYAGTSCPAGWGHPLCLLKTSYTLLGNAPQSFLLMFVCLAVLVHSSNDTQSGILSISTQSQKQMAPTYLGRCWTLSFQTNQAVPAEVLHWGHWEFISRSSRRSWCCKQVIKLICSKSTLGETKRKFLLHFFCCRSVPICDHPTKAERRLNTAGYCFIVFLLKHTEKLLIYNFFLLLQEAEALAKQQAWISTALNVCKGNFHSFL